MLETVVVPVLVTVKLIVPAASLIATSFTENDGRSSSRVVVFSAGVPPGMSGPYFLPVQSSMMEVSAAAVTAEALVQEALSAKVSEPS